MITLHEYYNTGDDGNRGFYQTLAWQAQTFTPAITHIITSIKLKLLRFDAGSQPGTITASIRATDVDGKPIGADLCSGTVNGNSITTTSPGEWVQITFSTTTVLKAGIKYAIVLRCSQNDPTHPTMWRKELNPSYTGGSRADSADQGASWTLDTNEDMMFEDWGEKVAFTYFAASSGIKAGIGYHSKA